MATPPKPSACEETAQNAASDLVAERDERLAGATGLSEADKRARDEKPLHHGDPGTNRTPNRLRAFHATTLARFPLPKAWMKLPEALTVL